MAAKIKFNYQTRLFFLVVVFTCILTFAFFMLQYTREKEFKVETLNANLQMLNLRILNEIERKDNKVDKRYIDKVSHEDSVRITVIDFNGNVLFDNSDDGEMENHIGLMEIQGALDNGSGYTIIRKSETNSTEYFYSATRGDSLVVRSALPYNESLTAYFRIDSIYMWIIVIIAVIVNVVAYFATKRLGQSVQNLSDFASQAESGNILTYDTSSFPPDELGEISKQIIGLYKKLNQAKEERDANMRNAMFEEREKVRIKHQLTSNINHEIKTPVHAIQACLETIVNNKEHFDKEAILSLIDKAYQNVQRLCSLLHDISVITRITEAGDQIKKTQVNVSEVIGSVADDVVLFPPEKQMRINIKVPDNVIVVGNETLIDAIFHNLVTNSLSYSGGRDIFIELVEETAEYYKFKFSDNGVGVAEEHLNRLFERFYRVDEGRSRKLGGTGLGLSIVKNAVLFHQGNISVRNIPTGGLEFTFTLHK